jgi:hypothetical protein
MDVSYSAPSRTGGLFLFLMPEYLELGLLLVHLWLKRMVSVTGSSFGRDSEIDHNAAD